MLGRRATRHGAGNGAFWALVASSLAGQGVVAATGYCAVILLTRRTLVEGASVFVGGAGVWAALALASVVLVGTALGVRALAAQVWAWRGLRRHIGAHGVSVPASLAGVAAEVGLAGRVDAVADAQPFALTYGLLRPRVLVSTGLLTVMSPAERRAVLTHERCHVRGRDPLKVFVARVLPPREFYLPVLRHLRKRLVAGRELAADRSAIDTHGHRALAGALLKAVEPPGWAARTPAPGLRTGDVIDARVRQLEQGTRPGLPDPAPPTLIVTAAGAALVAWAAARSAGFLAQFCPCAGC